MVGAGALEHVFEPLYRTCGTGSGAGDLARLPEPLAQCGLPRSPVHVVSGGVGRILGVGWALTGLLTGVVVGFLLIPVMAIVTVVPFVHAGYAAYRVSQGENYRYAFVAVLIEGR